MEKNNDKTRVKQEVHGEGQDDWKDKTPDSFSIFRYQSQAYTNDNVARI